MSKMAAIIFIYFRVGPDSLINFFARSRNALVIRNGIPSPIEKESNNNAACNSEPVVIAKTRMLAKIALTHGDQAIAKIPPARREVNIPFFSEFKAWLRCSRFKKGMSISFIVKRPKIIISVPPIQFSQIVKFTKTLLMIPKNNPSKVKIIEKPKIKKSVDLIIAQRLPSFCPAVPARKLR